MNLSLLRLLFDFGMLVLIWLVQLIIYPSFLYYQPRDLLLWHETYVIAISFVVIPLMFGQLITASIQLFKKQNLFTVGSLMLIAFVWLSTFVQFVPMHNAISLGDTSLDLLNDLIDKNWIRTAIWTFIFVWSMKYYLELNKRAYVDKLR